MFLIVLERWGAFFGVWIKVKYYKFGLFSMQMIKTFLFCTVFNLTQTVLGCWLGTSPTLGLNIVNQTRPQCRKNVWHCGPVSLWEANKCQSGPWWGCEVIYSIAHLRGSELVFLAASHAMCHTGSKLWNHPNSRLKGNPFMVLKGIS